MQAVTLLLMQLLIMCRFFLFLKSLLVLFLIQEPVPETKKHKPVEALAILYVLLHMWGGYIASYW